MINLSHVTVCTEIQRQTADPAGKHFAMCCKIEQERKLTFQLSVQMCVAQKSMLVGLWFSRKFWPALLDHLCSTGVLAYNTFWKFRIKQEGWAKDHVVHSDWLVSSNI